MRLGCSHLAGDGACKVYEHRPSVCSKYRCKLLKQVDAGEVEAAQAVSIVRDIRSIEAMTRARASMAMGEDPAKEATGSIHEVVERLNDVQTGSELSDPYVHAMLAYDHLVKLLRLHLKPDFEGWAWPD